jgi:myosin heavy subunit
MLAIYHPKYRDERVASILTAIQTEMRFQLAKQTYQSMIKRRDALDIVQSNIRAFVYLKDWEWMKIIFKIKPMISQVEDQKQLQNLEKNYEEIKIKLEKEITRRSELEGMELIVRQEKNDLDAKMRVQNELLAEAEDRCESLIEQKIEIDSKLGCRSQK